MKRQPYLAAYSVRVHSEEKYISNSGFTKQTAEIEQTEPDEYFLTENSTETRSIEGSGPDELYFSDTPVTFVVEETEPDEYYLQQDGIVTESAESSEPDESSLSFNNL